MKINYLELKNFGSIYTGMKKRKISIDFTKRKNRVTILVGETGSGKTSILRELHPYAYTTSDARSSTSELILEGEDGYKEIHIQDGPDIYEIRHFYKNHNERLTVKSFVKLNGEEMNPNGNVTSFKEYIENALEVDQNYLKLLRLGPNVETFVRMSTSQRKYFISELLSEIGIFQTMYKKINEDTRTNKTLLKSVGERMRRIGTDDVGFLETQLVEHEENLRHLTATKEDMQRTLSTIKDRCEQKERELGSHVHRSGDIHNTYKQTQKLITHLEEKLKALTMEGVSDVSQYFKDLTSKLDSLDKLKEVKDELVESLLQEQTQLIDSRDERLEFLSSTVDTNKLTRELAHEMSERTKLEKEYGWSKDDNLPYTSEDLKTGLRLLMEIQTDVNKVNDNERELVQAVVRDFIDGKDSERRIRSEIEVIDNRMMILDKGQSKKLIDHNFIHVIVEPDGHDSENCPYYKLFEETMAVQQDTTEHTKTQQMQNLEYERERVLSQLNIVKQVEYIMMLVKSNQHIIENLPSKYFQLKNILANIFNNEVIFDEVEITSFIDVTMKHEEYMKLIDRIERLENSMKVHSKVANLTKTAQKEIDTAEARLAIIEPKLKVEREKAEALMVEKEELEKQMKYIVEARECEEELTTKREEVKTLQDDIKLLEEFEELRKDTIEKLNMKVPKLQQILRSVEDTSNTIVDLKIKISELGKLQDEQEHLQETYEDLTVLRKALSSTEGIPLIFIQTYMDNTLHIVNELLYEVYEGSFEIDRFVINEKEFSIPYRRNGNVVSDISRCSQGEDAFVMIALSLALIASSSQRYDIVLLDEVDGPLDINKREKFISNLEKFMDIVEAEQVTIISHNNVFDNYPVDVIRTSNITVDNYRNLNMLFTV